MLQSSQPKKKRRKTGFSAIPQSFITASIVTPILGLLEVHSKHFDTEPLFRLLLPDRIARVFTHVVPAFSSDSTRITLLFCVWTFSTRFVRCGSRPTSILLPCFLVFQLLFTSSLPSLCFTRADQWSHLPFWDPWDPAFGSRKNPPSTSSFSIFSCQGSHLALSFHLTGGRSRRTRDIAFIRVMCQGESARTKGGPVPCRKKTTFGP